ncbi:MAG: RNA polymerase sigma factor [Bacteroidetes bacterium]|nr:RNA polymerase sigma factor [Bacteroidota bacterium]
MRQAILPVNAIPMSHEAVKSRREATRTEQHTMDLSSLSDGELLASFLNGNERAFAELYSRRHLEIYRFILNYVHGDEDLASDMFQETFIKVHNHAHTLLERDNVRSWMYTIARNNCLNCLKRLKRQVRLGAQHENGQDEDQLAPDEALDRSAMHQALDRAIQALPANQREAVILREFEGMSYAEIAEATHTNIGVIRQRLWRAKQTLRTVLAERFENRPAGESE